MNQIIRINAYTYGIASLFVILMLYNGTDQAPDIDFTFPEGFLIGTGSSAYQVEGAWNESGKGENIWDHFVHNHPEKIVNRSTGDVSCDSYHKYKEDIKLMKEIGINHYRFSLSWARILPTGYPDSLNKEGLQYYHNILDELEKHGIIPIVTLYHWDHPQNLERLGGWTNELMADFFADYAAIVFKEFGSRVKIFSTINEAYIFCKLAYRTLYYPPALNLSGWGEYACMHNMIKAHAMAYHIYNNEFRSKQNGQVGIVMACFQYYSKNKNDLKSGDTAFEFECGWSANPIFSKEGDYPKIMKQMLEEQSKLEGRRKSKLPTFSKEWIEYIKGSSDYFGLNHYTAYLVEPLPKNTKNDVNDNGLKYTVDKKWLPSQSAWLKIVPKGLGDVLRKIKSKYNNPPVYIMENGISDANIVNDNSRIQYLYAYMKEMLIAMKRDKCNIKAYTIWSFLDSFEWDKGYSNNFGLVHVDFNNPNRTRSPKKSVSWLKAVLKSRKLYPSLR